MPPQVINLPNSHYTIGWISALPHERAVAEAMLDNKHSPPQTLCEGDDNVYTLGSITCQDGDHNVVLATLPSGGYGTGSAALAADHLTASFPNIKLGLMVGIGGGIPDDKHDIRLGDVVVSRPNGRLSGIRRYDAEPSATRATPYCDLQNTKPRMLLNAMKLLRRKHRRRGSRIPEILRALYNKYPRMVKPQDGPGFVHPGPHRDRLFRRNSDHMGGKQDCDDCSMDDVVQRRDREYLDPVVHYGTIVSGDIVVKDHRIRDTLGKGCLCFETEAAGLMDYFPCLVIRGISDYCDSHKNDEWQRYAAVTAAAYAKELLQILPSRGVGDCVDTTRLRKKGSEKDSSRS